MPIESHGHEHEIEPQYGLPELLPASEQILWQGSPDFPTVAKRIFYIQWVVGYFALMLALKAGSTLADGGSLRDALLSISVLGALAVVGTGSLIALAWATARTAVYTITDKRIVMRIGIALTLTFNLPLRLVSSAGLRQGKNGCGDIVIAMGGEDHIAWLHLWPHARPWVLARPQPMLRAVPDAQRVAEVLARAWSEVTGAKVAAESAASADTVATSAPASVAASTSVAPGAAADAASKTRWPNGVLGSAPLA